MVQNMKNQSKKQAIHHMEILKNNLQVFLQRNNVNNIQIKKYYIFVLIVNVSVFVLNV